MFYFQNRTNKKYNRLNILNLVKLVNSLSQGKTQYQLIFIKCYNITVISGNYSEA